MELDKRHKNYINYIESLKEKAYSLSELMQMNEIELLNLMPNNQCVDEYSDGYGYHVTKYITTFKISKIIDGSWNIGYYEGHNDKPLKDQYTLFEIDYVKDLKVGLIDLFLMVQNRNKEIFQGIKSGRIKIGLDESWENSKN